MIVPDCLRLNARNHSRKTAIFLGERRLDYRELNLRVNRLANSLLSLGVGTGTIVGLLSPSGIEHLESMYALGKIGAVVLPVDDRWGEEEIRRTLDYFDAEAAIFPEERLATLLNLARTSSKLKGPLICTGSSTSAGALVYEQLLAAAGEAEPDCAVDEHDPFLIALSSGTTGLPRGAIITHRNMLFRFIAQIVELGFCSKDTFLNVTPMHHGGGRSFCMCHLLVGGSVSIRPGRFDPEATLWAMLDQPITTCFMVPTMYHRVLQVVKEDFRQRNRLRVLITSGAPLPLSTRQAVLEKLTPNFYDYYATVDGGGVSFLKPPDMLRKSDSVGQAAFGTEIKIVDEKKQEVPPGQVGEVMYRSPGSAKQYYNNPEATKECFVNGWFLPGDLARMDEEGFLYIVGRKKDMIIRGGINIYPPEIEDLLHRHPAVFEAAVLGVPDEEYGEEIAAFLVLKPGESLSLEELAAFCKARLASYKRPRVVRFVSSLPKASSGKVLKRELREMYLRGE